MAPLSRLRCLTLAPLLSLAILASEVAAQATPPSPHATPEAAAAELQTAFATLRERYLQGAVTPERSIEAYEELLRLVRGGLHRDYGHVAAEMIYQVILTSGSLHNRQDALEAVAEAAYEHRLADTSASGRASFLLALGNLEYDRGEYGAAAAILDSVLAGGVVPGSEAAFASGYNIRGFTYQAAGDWHSAPAAFDRAVELYASVPGQEATLMRSLAYAARANASADNHEAAIAHSNAAMALLGELGGGDYEHPLASNALSSHSLILQHGGDYDGAIEYARRALRVSERTQDPNEIAKAYAHLAHLARLERHYDEAQAYFWEALEHVPASSHPRARQTILEDLSRVFVEVGDFRQAYHVQDLSHHISDSLTRVTQALNVARLEENAAAHRVRMELARARAEAADQAVGQSQRQLALTWGALALVSLVGALAYLGYRLRRKAADHDRLERLVAARTADLERHARELERSNHELERFAYIASHDLKTPIRNVTSFLGLIRRRLGPEARANVDEYLGLALGYAHQMHALVTDVLEFSRIGADLEAKSATVDLRGLTESLRRERAAALAERNAEIEITGAATIHAPEAYLKQVLANLIENGLKYNRSAFPRVYVTIAAAGGGGAVVTVRDNGIGIAPAYQAKVFEMFQRLHVSDEFEGTGLGLAVCKKVVERLGGTIALASAEGEGATFTVTLPASVLPAEAAAVEPRTVEAAAAEVE